jgi:Na+/H+ antiporter NhaD/arsenite permease-like protein
MLALMLAVMVALMLALAGASAARASTPAAADAQGDDALLNQAEHAAGTAAPEHGGHRNLGEVLPLWTVIPFMGILLSIALFPLLAPRFWHHHFPKVSVFWALVLALPFVIAYKGEAFSEILHIYIVDYIPFIILLGALFTCSGGILLRGTPAGSPLINVIFLAIGTVLASMIGTTGASMLMIRPVLRANAARRSKVHVIAFFIFLVSNIGGSLTPLGDPPLFLGFLHGVPFFWTLRLAPETGLVSAALLAVFFLWDTLLYRREQADQPAGRESEPLRLEGGHNFIFLGGIVGGVILSGLWHASELSILGVHIGAQNIVRDLILIAMAVLAYVTTKAATRADNQFTWFPIKEVAILFFGIFMTIIPALAILKAGEQGALAGLIRSVRMPAHYFWASGSLSSFLDNAPTYLTFFNSALGRFYAGLPETQGVARLIAENGVYLKAISLGAVYMGANSYIGNAPNFMVRSIAEESGVKMPSFFGYMVKYSIPVLIPVFILVTLVFFQ